MRKIGMALAAVAMAAGATGAAWAQSAAEKQVEARKANFKKIGAAMKTNVDFVRNDKGTAADVVAASRTMATLAGQIPSWFPAGTAVGVGKSEALPVIWQKPADFRAAAMKLQTAANNLATVAAGGDKAAIGAALGGVGATCKGCHDVFRQPD
ncbi:MAG: cytochrome c [Alphaproteobacteria bacterium]|nr:cytochrome c [Alphaproteobacteria bacterium]